MLPTNILKQVITYNDSGLAYLENLNCAIHLSNKKFQNFENVEKNLGDTVQFDVPPRAVAMNGLVASFQSAQQRFGTLTCDQAANSSMAFTAQQFVFNVRDYMEKFGMARVEEISAKIEKNVLRNIDSSVPVMTVNDQGQSVPTGALHTESGPYRFYGDTGGRPTSGGQLVPPCRQRRRLRRARRQRPAARSQVRDQSGQGRVQRAQRVRLGQHHRPADHQVLQRGLQLRDPGLRSQHGRRLLVRRAARQLEHPRRTRIPGRVREPGRVRGQQCLVVGQHLPPATEGVGLRQREHHGLHPLACLPQERQLTCGERAGRVHGEQQRGRPGHRLLGQLTVHRVQTADPRSVHKGQPSQQRHRPGDLDEPGRQPPGRQLVPRRHPRRQFPDVELDRRQQPRIAGPCPPLLVVPEHQVRRRGHPGVHRRQSRHGEQAVDQRALAALRLADHDHRRHGGPRPDHPLDQVRRSESDSRSSATSSCRACRTACGSGVLTSVPAAGRP